MSAAYFIILDNANPGFDTMVNGKFLAQDSRRLETIAKSLGLRPLDEFVSMSPDDARAMMEEFGTEPEEIEAIELPGQEWFDAQEGLDFVAKVSDYIQKDPTRLKNVDGVLADLREYKQVFEDARAIGSHWNLQVDF